MYELSEYDFDLPGELIAQRPLRSRSGSKMLTVERDTGHIYSKKFRDIPDFFDKGDVLVLNETKVIPARIFGTNAKILKKIEILLLKEIEENYWEIMIKPGKRIKNGDTVDLEDNAKCLIQRSTQNGTRTAIFEYENNIYDYIEKYGKMPLPPYIERESEKSDKERYQTVYARVPGAVAAPTAGLHFTPELLDELNKKGVKIVNILLHVGAGTFRPIRTESILDHKMHSEYYEMPEESADAINKAKAAGKKICAVGTTAVRTLETVSDDNGFVCSGKGSTDIYIYPGYKFKVTDCLITNFHLPRSTLLLLVSAFSSGKLIKKAYDKAIKDRYRFYSYGDAMLII
ncbi:MAG: tRNA preQ1(34) S-adenosylmethionine ribosyltransferase-isomerase QueA [Candidatus Delongbacteria bacterium]